MPVTLVSTGIQFPDATTQTTAAFGAKAWVNFNGTGTVAIRAAFNVSSITDNGVGDYTVNFATALADANYSWSGGTIYYDVTSGSPGVVSLRGNRTAGPTLMSASQARFNVAWGSSGSPNASDWQTVCINFFR